MGKDKNAPKKPLTGYFKFLGAKRGSIKEANPKLTHKELTKQCGVEWNKLDKDGKAVWNEGVKAAMDVYKKKMAEYKTTDLFKEFQAAQKELKAKKIKKKKFKKDINAPKRPSTAYFIFCSKVRKDVVAELPDADKKKIAVAAKIMGKRWKALSEEERQNYKDTGAKLKVKYDEDFKAYQETEEYENYMEEKKDFEDKQKQALKPKKKVAKKPKSKSKSKKRVSKKRVLDSETEDDSSDSESSESSSS